MSPFTRAYLTAALWTSAGQHGRPLIRQYSIADFASDSLARAEAGCLKLKTEQKTLIYAGAIEYFAVDDVTTESIAGHNLWLTRNELVAGKNFRNSRWYEPAASIPVQRLLRLIPCELYVGEDGKIHIANCTIHPKPNSLVALGQRICLAGLIGLLLLIVFYLLAADTIVVN